jgi:hypothetical protein
MTANEITRFNAEAAKTVTLLQLITQHAAEAAAALERLAIAQDRIIKSI